MATELTPHRAYLGDNRRLIIGRALAAAAAGALPVPLVEDWLSSRIARGTIRKIADSRSVDLDEEAVRAVADGPERPPEWAEIAGGTIAYRLIARTWRKLVIAYLAVRRAQAATRHFLVGTLFDHYCARLHVGMGLDGPRAAELRAVIDQAIARTPGGLGRRIFRRGVLGAARASVATPLRLADTVTGGMVRRLLTRGDEVEAEQLVDDAIQRQLRSKKSFLARSAAAVELQLAAEGNPYIERLLETFENLWRARAPQPS
ncbi:MAG TPA: hypothetical protein VKZ63_18140 [Kofleriaceae bacterium]|nr:hypothetical protein [Kofleriaceae bacterium]